jgi:hypothetical protein
MHRVNPLQWVIAAIITVALGAVAFVLTNGASVDDDAAQNLQMAINVSHYGIMSMDENPPYHRTMYREPLPVATGAATVQIVDHFLGKADAARYFSGDRAKYIKYQNILWVILLWAAVLAATRWFTGSFWFSVGAGLLAAKPFLNGVTADGVNNLYTELPAAVLMICASFSLAFAVARARTWPMAIAGLCFGLLTLTKAATLYVFVGLVLVLLFSYARGEAQPGRRRRFAHIIVLVGTFAIFAAPWIARNFQAFGRPVMSDRGGFVLYNRALMNQVTPIEYRGSFYVWARPLLQPYVGSILGFSPRDVGLGGRLERLGGGVPGTAVYDHGRAAESAGRPEDTISFYHRARAERIRLEREFGRNHEPFPDVSADGMLQRKGMSLIKADVWANLAMVVPLLWRSAPLIFPALAFALGYGMWVKRYTLALFILPAFATLSFYALATQFEPRPASIAHATAVVSIVTMLHAGWLWLRHGRRMAAPAGSFSKYNEVGKDEVPNAG